jgi:hypothetical protein
MSINLRDAAKFDEQLPHQLDAWDWLPGFKFCRKGLHQYPTDTRQCPECRKVWRTQNKDKVQKQGKQNYEKYKSKKQEYSKQYRAKNLTKCRLREKKWREINKIKKTAYNKQWRKNNKDKVNANVAKRKALKKQAIPQWANLEAIKNIYKQADQLTQSTKIPHEVDHIYPLQSKYMCGLHLESNLQILTKTENATKKNYTWPGQLDCQKN